MAYTHPQVTITRTFRAIPANITDPMRGHISAGHAALHRYAVSGEKTNLGTYVPGDDTSYSWPDKTIGSIIDLNYTKLFVDGALLRYYEDPIGTGGSVAMVSGKTDNVRSTTSVFADNGAYTRDDEFLRPVKVGDHVRLTGVVDAASVTHDTYVKGFRGETLAAVIDSPQAASSNPGTLGMAVSVDYVSGPRNNIELQAHPEAFNALASGNVDETYTIEVVTGSVGGDLSTAILRIRSASGNDDVASQAAAADGAYFAVGTQGLYGEFNLNATASGSSAAGLENASPDDLVTGQVWNIHVVQGYTAPTMSSSGAYTGTKDTTYIAECVTGGAYGTARFKISTTTGVDVGGPVTAVASGTSFAVGSKGVRLTPTGGSGVRKGDKWYVTVTAEAEGAYQTLVLGHPLPTSLQDASDLALELFMKKNLQIGKNRIGAAPLTNYEATQTEFVVNSGITYLDDEWVDDAGEPVPLELRGGTLSVEYREWLQEYVGAVETATATDDLLELVGVNHPDNPLGFAVNLARANGGGSDLRFSAVSDPDDLEAWDDLLGLLSGRDDVYALAPMTDIRSVQNAFAAHVASQSAEEDGLYRGVFVSLPYSTRSVLASDATSDDGLTVMATLADDPGTSGTQYTYLSLTSGNVELEQLGVRPGDTVRYLYTTDGFGNDEYTEFPVEDVVNEYTLRLASAHTVAISVPQKVEIWRPLRRTEIAQDLASRAASFGSERVCAVVPDQFEAGGLTVPGYFLCAALAGLRGGAAPHQPLTHVELTGIDSVRRVTDQFGSADLDLMSGSGVWVVTADRLGTIYTRHAVTTDPSSLNSQEESVRTNLDSISFLINRFLKPYIGRLNVTPNALSILRTQIDAALEYLKNQNGNSDGIGPQLIAAEIVDIRPSALERDKVLVRLDLTIPYALNKIGVNLVV